MASAWTIKPKYIGSHFCASANAAGCRVYLKNNQPLPSPLKILMTTATQTEIWSYSLELAEALNRKGHQVILAAPGRSLSYRQLNQLRRLPRVELFENPYPTEGMKESKATGRWLLDLEQQVRPHLIHLNGYAYATLLWQAPKVITAATCLASWWKAVKGQTLPLTLADYQKQVKRSLQAADLVLTPTQTMLTALEENYGPLRQSQVVPVGRNPYPIHATKKRPYILTTSQGWDDHRNILNLERVAPRLPWPIYLAGHKNNHFLESGGLLPGINPLGQLSAKKRRAWFSHAAIYALPARYEPFGLAVLEAALAGCALVLSDVPNLREVWGDAALYIPADNPQALEVALVLLMADSNYRRLMAQRACTRAQKFTSERMAEQYLSHCQKLVTVHQRTA